MEISENQSLQSFNTFGVPARAAHLAVIRTEADLRGLIGSDLPRPLFMIGGGSNLLFVHDPPGTVVLNRIAGREVRERNDHSALVAAGAGEPWHPFVEWCLQQDLGGLENLSLIPGTVGAAPIQNIGAYGVELEEVFEKLEAIHLSTGQKRSFSHAECRFGYRDSIFKNELKGVYAITRVFLRLTSRQHRLNLSYGAIGQTLREMGVHGPSIRDVSRAVIHIRQGKLPDPARLGNAGSFFKNPEVEEELFLQLKGQFPGLPSYPAAGGKIKIPAGWLIEQCGWKGRRIGQAGCYDKQALVLVNHGGATGEAVWELARSIRYSVAEKFGIHLQPEVNII